MVHWAEYWCLDPQITGSNPPYMFLFLTNNLVTNKIYTDGAVDDVGAISLAVHLPKTWAKNFHFTNLCLSSSTV